MASSQKDSSPVADNDLQLFAAPQLYSNGPYPFGRVVMLDDFVSLYPCGEYLITQAGGDTVRMAKTGWGNRQIIRCTCVRPDGKMFVFASSHPRVVSDAIPKSTVEFVWSGAGSSFLSKIIPGYVDHLSCIGNTSEVIATYTGSLDYTIVPAGGSKDFKGECKSMTLARDVNIINKHRFCAPVFSPCGTMAAAVLDNTQLYIFSVKDSRHITMVDLSPIKKADSDGSALGNYKDITWSPDSYNLVVRNKGAMNIISFLPQLCGGDLKMNEFAREYISGAFRQPLWSPDSFTLAVQTDLNAVKILRKWVCYKLYTSVTWAATQTSRFDYEQVPTPEFAAKPTMRKAFVGNHTMLVATRFALWRVSMNLADVDADEWIETKLFEYTLAKNLIPKSFSPNSSVLFLTDAAKEESGYILPLHKNVFDAFAKQKQDREARERKFAEEQAAKERERKRKEEEEEAERKRKQTAAEKYTYTPSSNSYTDWREERDNEEYTKAWRDCSCTGNGEFGCSCSAGSRYNSYLNSRDDDDKNWYSGG